jgi:hypothetical protein
MRKKQVLERLWSQTYDPGVGERAFVVFGQELGPSTVAVDLDHDLESLAGGPAPGHDFHDPGPGSVFLVGFQAGDAGGEEHTVHVEDPHRTRIGTGGHAGDDRSEHVAPGLSQATVTV